MANKSFVLDDLAKESESLHIYWVDPDLTVATARSACIGPSYAPNVHAVFYLWDGSVSEFVDKTEELKNGDYDEFVCTNGDFGLKRIDEYFKFRWNSYTNQGNIINIIGRYNSTSGANNKYIFFFQDPLHMADQDGHSIIFGTRRIGYFSTGKSVPFNNNDIFKLKSMNNNLYPNFYNWWIVTSNAEPATCTPIITQTFINPKTYTLLPRRTVSTMKNYVTKNEDVLIINLSSLSSNSSIDYAGEAVRNGTYDSVTVLNNIFETTDTDVAAQIPSYGNEAYYILETQGLTKFIFIRLNYSSNLGLIFNLGDMLRISYPHSSSYELRTCILNNGSSPLFRKIG